MVVEYRNNVKTTVMWQCVFKIIIEQESTFHLYVAIVNTFELFRMNLPFTLIV